MSQSSSKTTRAQRRAGTPASAERQPAAWLAGLPSIVLVLSAYVWFVSLGTWTKWPGYSNYHEQLATAFSRGQLHLEASPDPALLALNDPYDPSQRRDVPFLSDASLYDGRYYLYFGPVPALLLAFSRAVMPFRVGDQHLTFVFTALVFLMLSLFLLELWRRFAPKIPAWIVGVCILAIGLITPFSWILSSRAAVHDAAIAAGQFFFLAGLYAAFKAADRDRGAAPWAALAGVLWAASLGSRITQVLPIVLVVLLWVLALRSSRSGAESRRELSASLLAMAIPLVLGIIALSLYNWARFGSVVETGISYQLALLPLQRYPEDIFAVRYILQNTYNYLLMPPKLRYNFPYLWPQMGVRNAILPSMSLSPLYFAENITGLVFTTPFLLFTLVPLASRGILFTASPNERARQPQLKWLVVALGGASLIGFGFFLVFFWAAHRYLLDFLPSALLLSVIGFWQLIDLTRSKPMRKAAVILIGFCLIVISIVVSNLVSIGLNAAEFRSLDPNLWMRLNNVFRP